MERKGMERKGMERKGKLKYFKNCREESKTMEKIVEEKEKKNDEMGEKT